MLPVNNTSIDGDIPAPSKMLPLIQCTIMQVLHRHKRSLTCSSYMVDYYKREIAYINEDNATIKLSIDAVIAITRLEAKNKGYNLEIIGGIYA